MIKKFVALLILFTMCTDFYAQYMTGCVEDLKFCHMYCKMNDEKYGTVGIVGTKHVKEINKRIYTEINIGTLKEDGSVRIYRRDGDDIIMYSPEILLQEGATKYYRQEGKKVYAYSEEKREDELVLDFSLNVNDTFVRANGEAMKVVEVTDTIPFVYTKRESGKKLVLQSENGGKDVWVEGVGSLYTGILSCDVLKAIHKCRLIGCSVSALDVIEETPDIIFLPFSEEKFKTEWMYLSEGDDNLTPEVIYEFLDDTLHIYGYMRTDCLGNIPLQCMVRGDKVDINEILLPGMLNATNTSVHKVDAKFSGFKKGVYQMSYNGGDPVEIVCGDGFHPMLQEGKFWKMEDGDGWASKPEYDILIEGDTLIGGKTWKKVYSNMEYANKDADGLTYYAAVREEGEKVYAIPKGKEEPRVLYDFSLKVGDKVRGTSTALDGFYCLLESDEAYAGWVTTMELKNIDVINVYGQELRRFTFDVPNNTDKSVGSSTVSTSTLVWVEGIGSEGGLFQTWKKLSPNSKTSCYLKDELIFDAGDFHTSNALVNIQEYKEEVNSWSSILYDLQGRQVDASNLKKGIYIQNGKKVLVKE